MINGNQTVLKGFGEMLTVFFGQSCCNLYIVFPVEMFENFGLVFKMNLNSFSARTSDEIYNHGISKLNLQELLTCRFLVRTCIFALAWKNTGRPEIISTVDSQFSPTS